jgi:hypothetical protein
MGRTTSACVAMVVLHGALGCIVGCSKEMKGRPAQPRYDAVAAGQTAVVEYDSNGDGKISGAELDRSPALKAAADQIDPSGRREITSEMIAARIREWQKSKLAGLRIRCRVIHSGKPVEDANVKFVPEKFLGYNGMVATGKTDKSGIALISHPALDALGRKPYVVPGFYRVEITKDDKTIPSKFNTQTILGLEIAPDPNGQSEGVNGAIAFDLKY